jgi:hypothetical protein
MLTNKTFDPLGHEWNTIKSEFSKVEHRSTWGYYYNSYSNLLHALLEHGWSKNMYFNPFARPFLFLIRHNLELALKFNISLKTREVLNTHELSELLNLIDTNPRFSGKMEAVIDLFLKDKDGACFRYYTDKDDNLYFNALDQFSLLEFCQKYREIICSVSSKNIVRKLCGEVEDLSLSTQANLTLYLGDCHSIPQLKSQYDLLIEEILELLKNNSLSINKIYLPLIFLIRHSMELGLKSNIYEIQKSGIPLIRSNNFSNEHSIQTLFNVYYDFLQNIDITKLDKDTNQRLTNYKIEYKKLVNTIHLLDSHSRYFRYPFDKKNQKHEIQFDKLDFIEVLKLLYLTNPFITFTNDILEFFGIIRMKT